jgi:hypothetical protein
MAPVSEGFYANVTLIDVQLASAYYPILVELAKHKHCLTYGELVDRAKKEYPANAVVQSAIAVSTGRRLDVVRMFTSERNLPDLSSLVINKGNRRVRVGFTRNFDPVATRESVFAFDWSTVTTDFDGFVRNTETASSREESQGTKGSRTDGQLLQGTQSEPSVFRSQPAGADR